MPAGGYVGDYLLYWLLAAVLLVAATLFIRRVRGRPGKASMVQLILGNGLVLLALSAVVLLCAETYYRYVYDATNGHGTSVTNRAWFTRHWVHDLNSWGYRDWDFETDKRTGTERVAFVGDSVVAGYGLVRPADRMSDRVRTELSRRSPGEFEVWNLGRIGWSTGDQLKVLRSEFADNGIDHIILGYSMNDIDDLFSRTDSQMPARPEWLSPRRMFFADTVWFRWAVSAQGENLDRYWESMISVHEEGRIWSRHTKRIGELAEWCSAQGTRLDVVVFPVLQEWPDEDPLLGAYAAIISAWRDVGARVIDTRELYASHSIADLVVNKWDRHPNELGHALAADAVLEQFFR